MTSPRFDLDAHARRQAGHAVDTEIIIDVRPRLAVVVDDGCCVCLRTGTGDIIVTDVDALITALTEGRSTARMFAGQDRG